MYNLQGASFFIFGKLFEFNTSMKKIILFFSMLLFSNASAQKANYQAGEYLKYRIHYGGLNAGFATIQVKNVKLNGQDHFHVVGKGNSSGAVRAFFKVDDRYETYIKKSDYFPSKFIRDVYEGGYKRHEEYVYDRSKGTIHVNDIRVGDKRTLNVSGNIQDILSAFYSMRNADHAKLKTGDFLSENIFISDEVYAFKLKVLGREKKKTKFGTVNTIKIQPFVQSGRIFKASESVTMWVTDDDNLVPVQIKAGLMVGSLKADIYDYKNLKTPINFSK